MIVSTVEESTTTSSSNDLRKSGETKLSKAEDREEIVELLAAPASNVIAPTSTQTPQEPLEFKWTLWYDRQNLKGFLNKQAYLKELTKGPTFGTISGFWKAWSEVQRLGGSNAAECNIHLFKEGITPTWEDAKNRKGGKWLAVIPSTSTNVTEQWVAFMTAVLNDEFGVNADVCGLVFSYRPWGNIFTLWNRSSKNTEQVEMVQKKLKLYFSLDDVKYKPHTVALKRHHTETKGLRPRSSSASSDSSASEGEHEKKKRRARGGSRSSLSDSNQSLLKELLIEMEKEKKAEEISVLVPTTFDSDFDEEVKQKNNQERPAEETNPLVETVQLEAKEAEAPARVIVKQAAAARPLANLKICGLLALASIGILAASTSIYTL